MYIPRKMVMNEEDSARRFIAAYPFGLMVSPSLAATHLPFILDPQEGEKGALYGHVARANPQWKELAGQRVLVVFSGPHTYISPRWYPPKEAVPTWNYAAVHCYGVVELLDAAATRELMARMLDTFEPGLSGDTTLMPEAYMSRQLQGIVGFKIQLDDVQGKEKLGQHRSRKISRACLQRYRQATEAMIGNWRSICGCVVRAQEDNSRMPAKQTDVLRWHPGTDLKMRCISSPSHPAFSATCKAHPPDRRGSAGLFPPWRSADRRSLRWR